MSTPKDPGPLLPKSAEALIADFLQVPNDKSPSRRRPTKDIGGLMETLLQKYQIGRDSPEHTIREHWTELVGGATGQVCDWPTSTPGDGWSFWPPIRSSETSFFTTAR